MAEEGDGDVGFSVSALAAVGVCRFAGEGADVVFGQLAFLFPFEAKLRGCFRGGRVILCSV